jgi:selenoprotein W-related protein
VKPTLEIHYCTQCRWLLRAAYFAQELLTTFESELGGVMLRPASGGTFIISAGEKIFWDRKTENGFPEIKELKQRIRDFIAPEKDLGHSDKS